MRIKQDKNFSHLLKLKSGNVKCLHCSSENIKNFDLKRLSIETLFAPMHIIAAVNSL